MFTLLSAYNGPRPDTPKDGDLYKELQIRDKCFRILYGYYADYERSSKYNDPIPIYPDFIKQPEYTEDGIPFATAMQDVCPHFVGKPDGDGDSCLDCIHFYKHEDLIGLCNCPSTRKPPVDNENLPQGGNE